MASRLESAEQLVTRISQAKYEDGKTVQALLAATREQAVAWFGADSVYVQQLEQIERDRKRAWNRMSANWQTLQKLLPVAEAMRDEVRLDREPQTPADRPPATPLGQEIFVVHGRDVQMKLAVARALQKLGLSALVLSEEERQDTSFMARIAEHPDVGFAIVLLAPDEMGYAAGAAPRPARPRGSQDLILQLGYFLGRLGPERVLALYRPLEGFELPTDPTHLLFTPFDAVGRWQFDLLKQLKACGYQVDAGRLLD